MTRSDTSTPSDRPGAPWRDGDPHEAGTSGETDEASETGAPSAPGASAATATGADAAADAAEARRAAARRRRSIDEVFGDVLPATTRDEREPGHRGGFSLEHYRSSRPPHWGSKQ